MFFRTMSNLFIVMPCYENVFSSSPPAYTAMPTVYFVICLPTMPKQANFVRLFDGFPFSEMAIARETKKLFPSHLFSASCHPTFGLSR